MEIIVQEDLRKIDLTILQDEVNSVIRKNLQVKKYMLPRSDADKEFDLARLPPWVTEVRIVEIAGLDKTPCKDLHVENTGEIGSFKILKVERAGKERYRFIFEVE